VRARPFPVLIGLLLVALVTVLAVGQLGIIGDATGTGKSHAPTDGAPSAPGTTAPGSATTAGSPTAAPSEGVAATTSPSSPVPATPGPITDVLVVPVTNFRAAPTATTHAELEDVLAGKSTRYTALELVSSEADPILAALKVDRPDAAHLILAKDEASLAADLTKNGKRLAFLRADEVGPEVRALAWGGVALFGVDRVKVTKDWPLTARLPAPAAAAAYDPATTWTLFAGGDIMLDRGVYQTLALKGKGADFPFDGGTADIMSRVCCSSFG
jgi:hypothetical protein